MVSRAINDYHTNKIGLVLSRSCWRKCKQKHDKIRNIYGVLATLKYTTFSVDCDRYGQALHDNMLTLISWLSVGSTNKGFIQPIKVYVCRKELEYLQIPVA
jgi:hypothetical protein